jgi:hypothetical protein
MTRYLLLLVPSRVRREELGRAELDDRVARFMAWVSDGVANGTVVAGARLTGASARVACPPDALSVIPIAEAPSAYFVVRARSIDEVVELAAACPGASPGTVEIHPLDPDAAVRLS